MVDFDKKDGFRKKIGDPVERDKLIAEATEWDFSALTKEQAGELCSSSIFLPLTKILPDEGGALRHSLSKKYFGKTKPEYEQTLKSAGETILKAYDKAEREGIETKELFEFIVNIKVYLETGTKGLGRDI